MHRRFPIAIHLAIFGLAILVPAAAARAIVALRLADAERLRLESTAQDFARNLARELDREIETAAAALEALATSPAVAAGDFATLDGQARQVLQGRGVAIAARDAEGQQVLDTARPWGAPLPRNSDAALRDADAQAIASGKLAVSNLFAGPAARTHLVTAVVPLRVNGAMSHTLSAAWTPDAIGKTLRLSTAPQEWIVAVTDATYTIVARSRQPERFVGSLASSSFRTNAAAGQRVWHGVSLDGQEVITVAEQMQIAPWRVSVSVTRVSLEEPLRKTLGGLAALTTLGLVTSLVLAFAYGRKLAGPIRDVAAAASSLASASPRPPPRSSIAEVQEISTALSTAALELRRRADDRDEAVQAARAGERRLRATYENAGVGIGEVDATGRFIAVNDALCRITGLSQEEMLRRRIQDLSDPEDIDEDMRSFREQKTGARPTYVTEKRFRRPDGELRWIRVFSTAVDDVGAFSYAVRVVLDVTDERWASEHQALLIAELNHRVKNTLAVVQSLAHQTLKSTDSPAQFREAFTGRVMALARSHELLSDSEWKGATLETLLRTSLEANDGPDFARTTLRGPDIRVGPRSVVSLSLMTHELATNATKYGALSRPQGRLAVTWETNEDGSALRLQWRETGGGNQPTQAVGGFGSRLVRLCIEAELGGQYEASFADGCFSLAATIPLAAIAR